jgi:Protein of unknown function (DUF3467)
MPDTKPPEQLESVRSSSYVSIYSNSANLEVTPWDFKLIFGAIVRSETGKLPKIENRLEVVMSPQHAKALLGIFASNVQEYEKQMGEIKLPQPQPGPTEQPKPS